MGSDDFPNQNSRCYLLFPIPKIQAFVCTEIAFWSRVNISQLFVVENIRGTKKKRRFHKTPDDGRGFFFFLGEKQKERYFWQRKDIGFSISQERKRLEQVVDNPQNRLTQLKTREKTRWSTRLCFLLILFLMTICTANTGYVYIYISLAKHLIPRKIQCFCFIYHVYRYNNILIYVYIYIALYICIWFYMYILFGCHFPTRKSVIQAGLIFLVESLELQELHTPPWWQPAIWLMTHRWHPTREGEVVIDRNDLSKVFSFKDFLFENGTFYPEFWGRWCFQRLFSKKHSSFPQFWVEMILNRVES